MSLSLLIANLVSKHILNAQVSIRAPCCKFVPFVTRINVQFLDAGLTALNVMQKYPITHCRSHLL